MIGHAVPVLTRASRARWLARRAKGISATDGVALLGLTPEWRTPLAVWLEKVQPGPDRVPSFPMLRGRAMESVLANEYARQHGVEVVRPPLLIAHPDHRILLASLDRVALHGSGPVPLELKTDHDWREWADDATPDKYAAQVLWQLMVTGLPEARIFADVAGRLESRTIRRDPGWEAEVIPRMLDWWAVHVDGLTPPPLDPYRDYVLLNRVWQPEPGEEIASTPAVIGAVEAYQKLSERSRVLDRLCTEMKTTIRAHMEHATVLTHHDTGQKVASLDKRGALRVTYKPIPAEEPAA